MENKGVISLKNNDFSSYWSSHDFILSPKTSSSHYGGMNINNYKAYGNEGTNIYVYFINNYKNKLGIPSFVSFSESNSGIYTAFKNDFAKSYRKTLDTLLSKNLKVLIYNGQNDFQVNTAGVLNYL